MQARTRARRGTSPPPPALALHLSLARASTTQDPPATCICVPACSGLFFLAHDIIVVANHEYGASVQVCGELEIQGRLKDNGFKPSISGGSAIQVFDLDLTNGRLVVSNVIIKNANGVSCPSTRPVMGGLRAYGSIPTPGAYQATADFSCACRVAEGLPR